MPLDLGTASVPVEAAAATAPGAATAATAATVSTALTATTAVCWPRRCTTRPRIRPRRRPQQPGHRLPCDVPSRCRRMKNAWMRPARPPASRLWCVVPSSRGAAAPCRLAWAPRIPLHPCRGRRPQQPLALVLWQRRSDRKIFPKSWCCPSPTQRTTRGLVTSRAPRARYPPNFFHPAEFPLVPPTPP